MRILYIATSSYPGDNAYSTRINGLCLALQSAGFQTDVLTDYSNNNIGSFIYQGSNITVGSKHLYARRTLIDKLLAPQRMIYNLKKMLTEIEYDCVIMSSIYMRAEKILQIVRSHDLPVILESCEWFEAYNWKKKERSYEYKRFIIAWNKVFTRVDGVIAISRMLEQHYKEYVAHVIRIPTIMSIPESYSNIATNDKIKLIFTGSIAWGKDRLIEVIRAIDEVSEDNLPIELHIYGPTKESVLSQLQDEEILNRNSNIYIHGRIPHEEVSLRCSEADFGIILRPDRKQSNAGFPTKLAEYMAVGASVIANDTGDISLYLVNGINGYVLPTEFTTEDLKQLFYRISAEKHNIVDSMKHNAFMTAKRSFDYNVYSDKLRKFIYEVICK